MPNKETAKNLRDAVRHLVVAYGALETAKRPCGAELPLPYAYALLELLQSGMPMRVSEIASRLEIDRTNVSRLCARMETAGDVARDLHPEDGRSWAIRLTAKGKKLARLVDGRSTQHFERLLAHLDDSADDTIAALHRLSSALIRTAERT